MSKPLIPFGWLPGSWGLKGRTRAIAEAEYNYSGKELELRLAEIHSDDSTEQELKKNQVRLKYGEITPSEHDLAQVEIHHSEKNNQYLSAVLEVRRQHGLISEYEYQRGLLELQPSSVETAVQLLDIELKDGRISQHDYDRRVADIKNEPWMSMPRVSWDPVNPSKTFFELDYNDAFLDYLRSHGYSGDEQSIVDSWVNDVCSAVASEMNSNRPSDNFVSTSPTKINRIGPNTTEYS